MNPEALADLHPRLFHMTADGAWPHIRRHGLLSTAAILDRVGVEGTLRRDLEETRRTESVVLETDTGDRFVLRDQKPLHLGKLERCLVDMTVSEWILLLNRKVFFWPSRQRCEELLGAQAYRDKAHTVIEVETAALLTAYRESITLSRINAGSVLYNPPKRGAFTFVPLGEVPFDEWRRKRGRSRAVAEVAVEYAVRDVADLATEVYRVAAGQWTRIA